MAEMVEGGDIKAANQIKHCVDYNTISFNPLILLLNKCEKSCVSNVNNPSSVSKLELPGNELIGRVLTSKAVQYVAMQTHLGHHILHI